MRKVAFTWMKLSGKVEMNGSEISLEFISRLCYPQYWMGVCAFLAQLVIIKGGLLQLKFGGVGIAVNIFLWAWLPDKVFHVSCSNLFCMFLVANSWTSSIMAEKLIQNGQFIVIFCMNHEFFVVGWNVFHVHVSFQNLLCSITNNQLSDKSNNGWKNFKKAYLLRFFTYHVTNFILW